MRRRLLVVVLAGLVTAAVSLSVTPVAWAQDTPPPAVPAPHIIPGPNEGHPPTEAGDRGGALQLGLLGLIVVAISGAAVHLTRASRRARSSAG